MKAASMLRMGLKYDYLDVNNDISETNYHIRFKGVVRKPLQVNVNVNVCKIIDKK